jgi:hypothetical protein
MKTETLKNHGLPKTVSGFINITDCTDLGKVCDGWYNPMQHNRKHA